MFRKIVRVVASLVLLGSIALGVGAMYVWLTPSEEQQLYDSKFQEATEKVKKAEAARGTVAEARLAQEAKEAITSANIWGRALRERTRWSRMGVILCGSVAFYSFVVLLLTFIKQAYDSSNARERLEPLQPKPA